MNEETQITVAPKAPIAMGPSGIQLTSLDEVWRFAGYVVKSGLAPKGLAAPEAIVIALQMGMEVGLPPMASLQNIAVINGRPTIWGDAQLAVVRATGELERFEETETDQATDLIFREFCLAQDQAQRNKFQLDLARAQGGIVKSKDDFGVSVFVKRKGHTGQFGRFTVADAKTARLWGKEGPWTNYPSRMLKFRARGFILRDAFGDALRGLISTEEARDTEDDRFANAKDADAKVIDLAARFATTPKGDAPEVAPKKAKREKAEPVIEAMPAPVDPSQPTGTVKELIEFMDANSITFSAFGDITDLTDAMPWLSSVPSVTELTQDQAMRLLAVKAGILAALGKGGAK